MQTMIIEEHCLCTTLSLVIARADSDGVYIAPIALWLWMNGGVAIHLAG
jgi:hypothetical protein